MQRRLRRRLPDARAGVYITWFCACSESRGRAVLLHEALLEDLAMHAEPIQDELLSRARLLERYGPRPGSPTNDTLTRSRLASLQELRFGQQGQVWRVELSFDPIRSAASPGRDTAADRARYRPSTRRIRYEPRSTRATSSIIAISTLLVSRIWNSPMWKASIWPRPPAPTTPSTAAARMLFSQR